MSHINLFYSEPDPDRWIKFDRYPRRWIRRILRGKPKPGGVMMVALELIKGLELLNIPYRFNDYKYAKQHPEELIGVIGKPHLIFERRFKNPILFGAGVFSHPIECPDLFQKYPNVKKILVPGEWMKEMCEPYYGNQVKSWAVGIDSNLWASTNNKPKEYDFLIYDKVRWNYESLKDELINPIYKILKEKNLSYHIIKYGNYIPSQLRDMIEMSKAVIFLCEHETQGIAYQQILSTDTPIFAWDRGGFWQDPYYYPEKVKFQPVSSVPYWDNRCGLKFRDINQFNELLPQFLDQLQNHNFEPRQYILENLTLKICTQKYVDTYQSLL
ncbi:hypothetical protein [Pedobacter sp. GR22-10]|uniref:hypothetical protein n=1 Tax=Pedobacter sp. GR22-10 TaxID=2994472 RepID=UPI002247C3AF|nr:hypothetical protein [Pedobacter sp. GR22-10]MCX2431359.1 hypothetical protein [Pedobacter sp. GR22-10]